MALSAPDDERLAKVLFGSVVRACYGAKTTKHGANMNTREEDPKGFTIRLPPALDEFIRERAEQNGRSRNKEIIHLLKGIIGSSGAKSDPT
jgi:hypothetical protein